FVLDEKLIDIFRGDELLVDLRRRVTAIPAAVHHEAGPALPQQIGGVALRGILDAELDEVAIRDADHVENGLDHAVLAVLRADLALGSGQDTVQGHRYLSGCAADYCRGHTTLPGVRVRML